VTEAYEDTLRWLYGLQPRGIRLELDRMRRACALRGHPQAGLRVVHVAGTNGKGSTSAMIERMARAAGLRTGLYTSPHLHSFTERIRIDGEPISRDEVVRRVAAIRAALEAPEAPQLTFFEVTTLLAFEVFAERGLDLVVLEVGLGGRLDATNVIERPLVTVITHVDLDHQQYLGTTLAEIAREKAGIVKHGVSVVHAADGRDDDREGGGARAVIDARAAELGAPSFALGRELTVRYGVADTLTVALSGRTVDGLWPALHGRHQETNAALAVGAVLALAPRVAIDADAIRTGVSDVRWPGRLEEVVVDDADGEGSGCGRVLLDAAHNPDGARALARFVRAWRPPGERVALLFGAMADKDWRAMLSLLRPAVDEVVYVAPDLARAERPEVMAAFLTGAVAPSIRDGVDEARLRGDRVVVCGSIFVLAEARAHLLGLPHEPPIPM
jgi:dihydrofolate synthase/folylpolyglutamate synthase